MKIIDLNGRWEFRAIDRYGTLPGDQRVVLHWMPSEVPGTVHTDLLANGRIPDPFYRMNEHAVQWVDSVPWVYRREFRIHSSFLDEDAIYLLAEGLDTYARIICNGKFVGETANMFVEHRLDIKPYLRPGRNSIRIILDSPTQRSKLLEKKHGALNVALEPHRVYVRKAQYSFSWDWGPKLTTSGIWRNISIEGFSLAKLRHPFIKVVSADTREARIQVSVEIQRVRNAHLELLATIVGEGTYERTVNVNGSVVTTTFRVQKPLLWWPHGSGDQPMYTAVLSLLHGGKEIDQMTVPFAIRTVRLLQKKDREGKSFVMEVNGTKVFCKGANWIPSSSFLPKIPASTYEALLRLARDAHMNLIRVWGGGIYEQQTFYNLCDQLGLMVWQDFMYACGEYPEQQWFLRGAKEEAEKAVRRLRNHPSIVLWCGNNECEWLFCTENPGKTPDDMGGTRIFRDILPDVCKRLDGTRPYWRSSPFGDGFPNDESNGNHHQWSVWSNWRDYKEYSKSKARFVTEFGFQSPANMRTMKEVTLPVDRRAQSPFMEHRNKQFEGPERLFRFLVAHYLLDDTFDDFIYKGQLVQAEALKYAVEHWRRRKFGTAGTIFWQLNDCWPASSWSVIDNNLRPKAGYYYAKRFFAPVLVSFFRKLQDVEVWIVNDLNMRKMLTLSVSLRSMNGSRIWEEARTCSVEPNGSASFLKVKESRLTGLDITNHYLHATVLAKDSIISENRFFFVEPKHLRLPGTTVTFSVKSMGNDEHELTLRSKMFAGNVRVEIKGEDVVFSDNYIHIDGGIGRVIRFRSKRESAELRRRVRLHWLEKGAG